MTGAKLVEDHHGESQSAYYFDGKDDYIKVTDSDSLNFVDKMSVSFWIKPDQFWSRNKDCAAIICKMKEQDEDGVNYQNGYLLSHDHHHGRRGKLSLKVRYRPTTKTTNRVPERTSAKGYNLDIATSKNSMLQGIWTH